MKKILLTAAVTAALFAGQASAVVPTIPGVTTAANLQVDFSAATGIGSLVNVPATNIIHMAGSSAATKFLGSTIQGIAEPTSVIYLYTNIAKDVLTYVFTAKTGVDGFTAGSTYVVHKRDRGGSIHAALAAAAKTPDAAKLVTFNQVGVITKAAVAAKGTKPAIPAVTTPGSLLTLNIPCSAPVVSAGKASLATCTATIATTDTVLVPATKTSTLVGITDVDALQFASQLNGADAVNKLTGLVGKMKSTAIAAQVFGIAVNLKLRDAMQVAEMAAGTLPATCADAGSTAGNKESEACMPSFTSAQITSLFAKDRMNDWTNLTYGASNLVAANGANLPANTAVHLCSRAAGSGTLATFNTVFENAPCAGSDLKTGAQKVTEAIQAGAESLGNSSTAEGALGALKAYHSTIGSGDLENCLLTMEGFDSAITSGDKYANGMTTEGTFNLPTLAGAANFRWAVGILNADRNETNSKPYRFVKVDGFAPSLVNTANGNYKYWSELAVIEGAVASTGVAKDVAAKLITAMADPAIIVKAKKTHVAGFTTGYLAEATQALPGTKAFDLLRPVMPFTHSDSAKTAGSLNHCRAATILTGTANYLPGLK